VECLLREELRLLRLHKRVTAPPLLALTFSKRIPSSRKNIKTTPIQTQTQTRQQQRHQQQHRAQLRRSKSRTLAGSSHGNATIMDTGTTMVAARINTLRITNISSITRKAAQTQQVKGSKRRGRSTRACSRKSTIGCQHRWHVVVFSRLWSGIFLTSSPRMNSIWDLMSPCLSTNGTFSKVVVRLPQRWLSQLPGAQTLVPACAAIRWPSASAQSTRWRTSASMTKPPWTTSLRSMTTS